jgi:hypothetical protein
VIRHSSTEPSKVNRICLWSDREGSEERFQLLKLPQSPKDPRVISFTSSLHCYSSCDHCPDLESPDSRNLEIPTKLLIYHYSWCYPTLYGVNWSHTLWWDRGFLLRVNALVPHTPLLGKDPQNHKANKQNRQLIIFLSCPHNLLELLPDPYKRISVASIYSFSLQGYML